MDKSRRTLFGLLAGLCAGAFFLATAQAQEEVYRLEHIEIFGKLRRPAIAFDHAAHVAALDKQGCGACHHGPDPQTGRLTYLADEEEGCSACHGAVKKDRTPALREAFHGSCTACHRRLAAAAIIPRGPTTCGQCHLPHKP